MEVKVGDGFAGIGPVVDDEAKAGLMNAEGAGDFDSLQEKVAEGFLVGLGGIGDAGDRFPGNDENVAGRAGIDIAKGKDDVVFIDDLGRDFASGNFFEKGFAHDLEPSTHDEGARLIGFFQDEAFAQKFNDLVA